VAADNKAELARLEKLVQEDITETEKLIDTPAGKGLRTKLVEERVKREGIEEEYKLVEPLYLNAVVEGGLLGRRLRTMKARIDELEGYRKKRNMDIDLPGR